MNTMNEQEIRQKPMRPNFNIEPLTKILYNIYHIRIFIPKVVTSKTYTRNILTENDEERERDSKHRPTTDIDASMPRKCF